MHATCRMSSGVQLPQSRRGRALRPPTRYALSPNNNLEAPEARQPQQVCGCTTQ